MNEKIQNGPQASADGSKSRTDLNTSSAPSSSSALERLKKGAPLPRPSGRDAIQADLKASRKETSEQTSDREKELFAMDPRLEQTRQDKNGSASTQCESRSSRLSSQPKSAGKMTAAQSAQRKTASSSQTAPGRPGAKTKRRHPILRRFVTGVVAVVAGFAAGGWLYMQFPHPAYADGQLSEEEIEAMVRQRMMNQTSKGLDRIPVFAHRGFVEDSLDNTFASFDLALLSGCPQIELDVRCSSDGVLYVCHDDTLKAVADLGWKVKEHTSEELDGVILKNGEKLHRLSEVIGRYRDQLIYLIEFKDELSDPKPFLDVVEAWPQYTSTMQIQSFYPETLESIHKKLPNLFVQLLIQDYKVVDDAMTWPWLDSLALSDKLISEDRIHAIHEAGKEVWLWTIDDPEAIHRYLSWGADGVITDLDSAVTIYKEMASGQLQ